MVDAWLIQTLQGFADRTLPIDEPVASAWAELSVALRRSGQVVGAVDELIAATALANDLTVVTRNVRHFEPTGCRLICPWTEA